MQLSRELGIAAVSDLEAAVSEGKLRNIAGFGPKSEERILRGLAVMTTDRVLLNVALSRRRRSRRPAGHTEHVEYAGSLRRWREDRSATSMTIRAPRLTPGSSGGCLPARRGCQEP